MQWFGRAPLVLLTNVVSYAFILMMAICFRQSFNELADRSGKRLFRTVGIAVFIGAIVTFVLYIGAYISVILYPIVSVRAIQSEFADWFLVSSICSSFVVSVTFMILAVLFFTLKTNSNRLSHSCYLPAAT
ncbi:MAG: DUF996 domain-containing protein [Nitrososphaerota archaeon]|jgi:uncharacterized BrkB/YihY/UPF0761 family membrane protein|nr:DUF996 domain-containing protein [Nitrososphaerota archaeon]